MREGENEPTRRRSDGFSFFAKSRNAFNGSKSQSSRQEYGPRATQIEIISDAKEEDSVFGGVSGYPFSKIQRTTYRIELGYVDNSVVHDAFDAHNGSRKKSE